MAIAYIPHPTTDALQGFPGTFRVKSKTMRQGGNGLRARWKDANGRIYEWDYMHGRVEVYGRRGRHQGEFDYPSGRQVGAPDNSRQVEP